MFERFTGRAREAVVRARAEARALGAPRIGAEHLLLAVLSDAGDPVAALPAWSGVDHATARADLARPASGGVDGAALAAIGVDLDAVRAAVESEFGEGVLDRGPSAGRSPRGSGTFSPDARKVLELALREAVRAKCREIATGHLLLGVLRLGGGPAVEVLAARGVDLAALRREVEAELGRAGGRAA